MKKYGILVLLLSLIFPVVATEAKKKGADKPEKEETGGQTVNSFGLYPSTLELECPAGQRVTTSIKVENPSPQTIVFEMIPTGLVSTVDGVISKPITSLPTNHLSRHISFEEKAISVPGKSYREFAIYLDVPSDLKGSQYTGFSVSRLTHALEEGEEGLQRKAEYETNIGVGLLPGIGVTIKCSIPGTMQYAYQLESITVKKGKGNQLPEISMKIKNMGNGEIPIYGMLLLMDGSKKVVARLKTVKSVTLYPGASDVVELESPIREIPSGKYTGLFSQVAGKLNLSPQTKNVLVP